MTYLYRRTIAVVVAGDKDDHATCIPSRADCAAYWTWIEPVSERSITA